MKGDGMDELLDGQAVDLSAALAAGRVSAEAVMRATLERIASRNHVNAIVSLRDPEVLIAEARAADAGPRKGWLHGIPMAIKDLADARGLPTSWGSPLFAGTVAARDEPFVARLRAAGAILIGKTNTPEFGLGSHTFNPVFGPTRNPYARGRTPGGSSGGAAAALAMRMVTVADGSDMMGSLRNPAGWCNVYGFRPSWGRVPAAAEGETFLHPLSTDGPMARSPADLAALLDVMSGPVAGRPFGLPRDGVSGPLAADLRGRRLGWLGDWGGAYPMEAGVLDTCARALGDWAALGVEVEPLPPPMPAADLWEAWLVLRHWAVQARLGPIHDDPARRSFLKPAAIWEIEEGRRLTRTRIERAALLRSEWYRRADALFDRFDAIVLPTAQVWPFAVEQVHPEAIAGQAMDTYHRWMEVVVPASLIGLPALAVPAGFGAAGLPMGLQLIGRHGADLGLLQLAEGWHAATGWPDRRPPVYGTA
jgi:amidase